jgi:N-acetylneuraminate synthase
MNNRVFVVGEIGINGNGSMPLTRMLIKGAKDAGCSAVKFQKRIIEETYTEEFLNSERNDNNPYGWVTQGEQKRALEYSDEDYWEIDSYCRSLGLDWFCSAWSVNAQLYLRQFNLKYNKVASALLNNISFLHKVAEEGKYTFLSTGMSTMEEISQAVDIFRSYNCPFQLLYCNSSYPSLNKDMELFMIDILKQKYGVLVGISDHCVGRIISFAAVAKGACTVEKHITFNRDAETYELIKEHLVESKVKEYNPSTGEYDDVIKLLPYGSDQWASITIDEMKKLVVDIRQLEPALDINITKNFNEAELAVRKKLRG